MRVGIIRYPGSNCDNDILRYFKNSFYIWHKETELLPNTDLIIIPGGFAFGDRIYKKATSSYSISPGSQAINSPVSKVILEAHEKKIPIIGICNGFQILIKLGLLEGELNRNTKKSFNCETVKCRLESSLFEDYDNQNKEIMIPIANQYGNYYNENYQSLIKNDQVFLRYFNYSNGSIYDIAGVSNKNKTVFGMMPHPERMTDKTFFAKFVNTILNKDYILLKKNINMIMSSEHVSY